MIFCMIHEIDILWILKWKYIFKRDVQKYQNDGGLMEGTTIYKGLYLTSCKYKLEKQGLLNFWNAWDFIPAATNYASLIRHRS